MIAANKHKTKGIYMMKKRIFIPILTSMLILALASCTGPRDPSQTETTKKPSDGADHYHEYIDHVFAPTCVSDGQTAHTCHICGDTYFDSIVPMLGHSYEGVVTQPTCTAEGYTTFTCSTCGHVYRGEETPKREHVYLPNVVEPTCAAEGYTKHVCAYCRDSYTDTPVAKTEHFYLSEKVAPTAIERGYTLHTCWACGHSYQDEFVEPNADRKYIVDFNPNGGALPTLQVTYVYRAGEDVTLPVPTLEGHVFMGWYTDVEDEATLVKDGPWAIASSVWLTAKWEPIVVEFKLNMGEGGQSLLYGNDRISWGEPIGSISEPVAKFGYTFDGWFDGETRITADMVSRYTEPVTFTAKWLAPLASGRVSGDGNSYDWAIYADGTLRFMTAKNAQTGEADSFAIAEDAFCGMSEIRAVELPENLTDIGRRAFADCVNLKEVLIPGSAKVIRSSVFEGCVALERVTLGSGIRVLNEDAFRGCSSLRELTLPLTLLQIYSPFEGCVSLSHVRYEGTAFQWGVVLKDDAAKEALEAPSVTYQFEVAVK